MEETPVLNDRLNQLAKLLRRNESGQDLIEYALMGATVAVAVAAIFPSEIAPNISHVFSKIQRSLGQI